jgi:hypothetical protein
METGGVADERRAGRNRTKIEPFRLGPVAIDPPARQLTADAQVETIEPRRSLPDDRFQWPLFPRSFAIAECRDRPRTTTLDPRRLNVRFWATGASIRTSDMSRETDAPCIAMFDHSSRIASGEEYQIPKRVFWV